MEQFICLWCNTLNPATEESCIACGAPLGQSSKKHAEPEPSAPLISKTAETTLPPPSQDPAFTTDVLKKAGEQVEQVYTSAISAYGVLWRTLGEAIAIALSAFLLGMLAGAMDRALFGALAGLIIGAATGLVTKSFWWHLLTPLGVILGALLGLIPWALGIGAWIILVMALAAALITIRLDHRSTHTNGWYSRLRPFLGAAGGVIFSMLGVFLGWVLQWVSRGITDWLGNL